MLAKSGLCAVAFAIALAVAGGAGAQEPVKLDETALDSVSAGTLVRARFFVERGLVLGSSVDFQIASFTVAADQSVFTPSGFQSGLFAQSLGVVFGQVSGLGPQQASANGRVVVRIEG